MTLVKALGKIIVEPHKGRMVVEVSRDFSNYYNWFLSREYWISLGTPLHKPHITLSNSKFHSGINWKKAMSYHGKQVEFDYDVNMVRGGYNKGFIMFYIKIFSEELENLKKRIGVVEGPNYKGLHITIANSKGTNLNMYWPKMITV